MPSCHVLSFIGLKARGYRQGISLWPAPWLVDESRGPGLGKRQVAARDVGQWLARGQAKYGAARSHGLNYASHCELSQGRRAMRLTLRTNRWAQAAMLAAWVFSSGCQRLPYID